MPGTPIRKVVVIGDGGWGTAIALLLDKASREASIWSYDPEYAAVMRESASNPRYLPGFPLPDSITIGSDFDAMVADADLLISAVPTAYLRDVWAPHRDRLPADLPIASVSKGLEQDTLLRPTQILAELLGESHHIAVLSGPNIAREIAAGMPAASVIASPDDALCRAIQEALSNDAFRIYRNPDPVGVELGGVLKNVIALAAGICDGLELGVNAKAALVARGLLEMARLGMALGGKRETFFGLAGLGDLMTTCYSPSSRNRTFGERLGRGELVEDIIASMQQVAEGAKSVGPLQMLMKQHGLAGPITEEMNLVINEGKLPRDVVTSLMRRAYKDEAEDLGV